MELRTNELFKSYLQQTVISKTPSPEPQVTKYRDNLRESENNAIKTSISNLCTMIENCQVQLQASNELISKLTSPESEFIVVQKAQLKEFLEEFKQEFHEFKNEIKTSVTAGCRHNDLKPSQSSQKSIFNKNLSQQHKSSQKSIFSNKPLTPPPSFEAMLERSKFETFSGKLECAGSKDPAVEKNPAITSKMKSNETPVVTYKIEKRRKENVCKKKRQKLSSRTALSLKDSTTDIKMQNTQNWLESLPVPPKKDFTKPSLNKLLTSSISHRKMKDKGWGGGRDSDNESLGKWSVRSIRTYKSSRSRTMKRGANFVKVERVARSEVGWGQFEEKIGFERNYRSEY